MERIGERDIRATGLGHEITVIPVPPDAAACLSYMMPSLATQTAHTRREDAK